MTTESHPRFKWAREIIRANPRDHILEIGCGAGLLVEELVQDLKTGKVTAIDRSASMIDKAIRRNANSISTGRAEFSEVDWKDFKAGKIRYDKIVFFNINFFWTNKSVSREVSRIRSLLSKNGKVYIFYGPMFNGGFEKIVKVIVPGLAAEQLPVKHTIHNQELSCCCFVTG